jgi:superfamily II DNA or RNA helicase
MRTNKPKACWLQADLSMDAQLFLIDPQSLERQVSKATFERGLGVYRAQNVLEYDIAADGVHSWTIDGIVLGSKYENYQVSVQVETTDTGQIAFFNGECDCPVGYDCKHCVALTLKAAYKSGAMRATTVPVKPALSTPELHKAQEQAKLERERQQAQQKVTQWLDLFGNELADAEVAEAAGVAADSEDKVVFLLSAQLQRSQPTLQLTMGTSRRLRNGAWAKLKHIKYLDSHKASPQELEVGRLIDSLRSKSYAYGNYGELQCVLAGSTGLLALELAAATGNLFASTADRVLGTALRQGPARTMTWKWNEVTSLRATEPSWALVPHRTEADAHMEWFYNSPPLYLDTRAGLYGILQMPGMSAEHLALLMNAPPIPQSAFAQHETTLLRRLAGLPLPPVMHAPSVVQGVAPIAHLHFERLPTKDRAQLGLLRASLRFEYGTLNHYTHSALNPVLIEQAMPASKAPEDSSTSLAQEIQRFMLHRDLVKEFQAIDALSTKGLVGDARGRFHLPYLHSADQQRWLQWVDEDFALFRDAGFHISVEPGLANWIARADSLDVNMAGLGSNQEGEDLIGGDDSQSPWFDLSLGIHIDGERHNILPLLPALLEQMQAAYHVSPLNSEATSALQMPAYIYLPQDDGSYMRLPTEPLRPWLQALLELVGEREGKLEGDSLRLSRLEAMRVGAALGAGVHWSGADSLRLMVQQLAGHSALPEISPPDGLAAQLRPYQQQGLEWLQFLRTHSLNGILADDMGLGKTLQTLAHILVEKQAGRLDRPALIIAPVSLMGNWRREVERFTPELRAVVLHGKDRHGVAAEMSTHDVVIAPYSLLQRDRERWVAQAWHIVVLDEAQNIKNANTHAAQVVGELNTRHRLCLSGTPMENHLGELWSLFHFLMPGFLGSQARFKDLFRTPIEKLGDSERADHLRRRITPFMLRRAKADVATDLPEKQISLASVELGDKQADLYETIRLTTQKAVREALANKGLAKSQIQVLDALLKLRQVCCDPRLVPVASAKKVKQSAKLDMLMDMLPEMLAAGRKVLLFSQFTSMLSLIEEALAERKISWVKLTGQSQNRDEIINRFTSGEVPLFLISLKAGGVGLNLTQADTVIHYDPWWNPAVENQATDRAHRIGQTQRVMVYKLVAQGTIEERILALQERKAALADSMYSASAARKQPLFTESDLAELLKPLGAAVA